MKLPSLTEQIEANLVTSLSNDILFAIKIDHRNQIPNTSETPRRVLPPGIYVREGRHLYAAMSVMVGGRRTQKQVARGLLDDFSPETVQKLVEALKKAKAQR